LEVRGIPTALPEIIYERAQERYHDAETGHMIAVMEVELYGRIREVSLVYVTGPDAVRLLTIHPLKDGQKKARVASGRWRTV
jgi:hypothetical protein